MRACALGGHSGSDCGWGEFCMGKESLLCFCSSGFLQGGMCQPLSKQQVSLSGSVCFICSHRANCCGTVSITANIPHSSGHWQVLGQTPAGGVSGAGPFPAVWMAIFHCMFLWGRGLRYFGGFFSRVSDVIHENPAFMTQTPAKHQAQNKYKIPSQEAVLP